jgi:hypothetical protein
MLNTVVVYVVEFSARYRWPVIIFGSLLMVATACFDYYRFAITTDVEALISRSLPWHQRQIAFTDAFPQNGIAAVVTAPTAESAELATNALTLDLEKPPDLFRTAMQPDSGEFFERNGLLFATIADVKQSIGGLSKAQFLVSALASDPSLSGVMKSLSFTAQGVLGGQITIDQLVWPLSLAAKTLSEVLSDGAASFSWQELMNGEVPQFRQLRHFIEINPVLD